MTTPARRKRKTAKPTPLLRKQLTATPLPPNWKMMHIFITDECIDRLKREGREDLGHGVIITYRRTLPVPIPEGQGCYLVIE